MTPTGGSHGKPHRTTKVLSHAWRRGGGVAARGACAAAGKAADHGVPGHDHAFSWSQWVACRTFDCNVPFSAARRRISAMRSRKGMAIAQRHGNDVARAAEKAEKAKAKLADCRPRTG